MNVECDHVHSNRIMNAKVRVVDDAQVSIYLNNSVNESSLKLPDLYVVCSLSEHEYRWNLTTV